LARKLVEKGEETVSSRPETAFQYCLVCTEVLKAQQNNLFEDILMSQFQAKCPLVVPYYKPRLLDQQPPQTDNEYRKSIGYKVLNDGRIEEDVHYFKRMSGVLHLYFTLLVQLNATNIELKSGSESESGGKLAWQWISDMLNMTPRPNTTPEALTIFFKCCGHMLHVLYGNQFLKLVATVSTDYMSLIESMPGELQSAASVGRLKALLDEFKKNGNRFAEWKR